MNLEMRIDLYTTHSYLKELVTSEFLISDKEIKIEKINGQEKFHIRNLPEEPTLLYLDMLEKENKLNGAYYLIKDSEIGSTIRMRAAEGKVQNF